MKSYRVEWYHQVPPHVKEILRTLHERGHIAYIVGGAVRDLWLNLTPKDFDVASNASVEEIAALFPKTLEVGKQFGIMVVVTDAGDVEVARFRTDGEYTDSRHPSEVTFTDPAKDAERRDFTINGLFYDTSNETVVDYVDGVADLEKRLIRTVGKASDRFAEDALRMLRAFRFFAQIPGAKLDPAILAAVAEHHDSIRRVSRERITQEFLKLLNGEQNHEALIALATSPLWTSLFSAPTWTDKERATLSALMAAEKARAGILSKDFLLTLLAAPGSRFNSSVLLLPKVEHEKIKTAWKTAEQLARFHTMDLAEQKTLLARDEFELAWSLVYGADEAAHRLEILRKKTLWEKNGALRPEPLLRAEDLLQLGHKPGPKFGEILGAVRSAQLREEVKNKADALKFVSERFPLTP